MDIRATGRSTAGLAAALVLLGALGGCSVEKHYETLSFFFDGVPDPNQPAPSEPLKPTGMSQEDYIRLTSAERSALLGRRVTAPVVYYHEPVKQRLCHECHGRSRPGETMAFTPGLPTLLDSPERLCGRCHEPPSGERVHGPAGAGLCTACHLAHQSSFPFLLRSGSQAELCGRCHTGEIFVTAARHAAIGETPCTTCHDPHAAQEAWLLKDPSQSLPAASSEGPARGEGGDG